MTIYIIYSFEIIEGGNSLFYKDTQTKAIDKANEIINNIINGDLIIVGQKRSNNYRLEISHKTQRDNIHLWELRNVKDLAQYEGHEKTPLESHPGSYVIFDNRPNICQIAIEKNNAFDNNTDKVAKYINNALNNHLKDYGLKMVIKLKYLASNFKDIIRKRIIEDKDSVKKVVWEFPNPNRVKGIDATQQMKNQLNGLMLFTKATNALKGKLMLTGSKKEPIDVDSDKIDDWAQIIALSAQNNYKLSYYFYNSPVVNFKDVAYAFATIDNKVIIDFESGQLIDKGEGTTFELIEILDEIRIKIADYDCRTIAYDGE